jgi:hypothetical protein
MIVWTISKGNYCHTPTSKMDHYSKLLTIVSFTKMIAQRGGTVFMTTTESDRQEERLS